jgi:hypothetical protein
MRPCPVTGCIEIIKPQFLMCWKHWKMVPIGLQRIVNRLYEREFGSEAYMKARNEAIAVVDGKVLSKNPGGSA